MSRFVDQPRKRAKARPRMASASTTAKPIQAVPIIAPRASGCRAVPWITEAKIRPTPMPEPMTARPYPTRLIEPLISIGVMLVGSFQFPVPLPGRSVFVRSGRGHVRGGQDGEDVGLEGDHQELQSEDRE